jgi:hypothetical protein
VAAAAATLLAAPPHVLNLAAAAAVCLILVCAVVAAQSAELRLPLTFYRSRRAAATGVGRHPGLAAVAAASQFFALEQQRRQLPLRLSPSGARQLLFANFWVGLLGGPVDVLVANLSLPSGLLSSPLGFAGLVFLAEAAGMGESTPKQLADFLAQVIHFLLISYVTTWIF